MRWSELAWTKAKHIINNIENCNFVKELAEGRLPIDKFIFYIEQDNIYLHNFSDRLHLLENQVSDADIKKFIHQNIEATLLLETSLHAYIGEHFNTSFDNNANLTPANKKYISLTDDIKLENNPAYTYASLLPCFWVYTHIGSLIYKTKLENNPFSSWIDAYADESFINETETFRRLCDNHAATCNPETRTRMNEIFYTFTELELNFWNDSYSKNNKQNDETI